MKENEFRVGDYLSLEMVVISTNNYFPRTLGICFKFSAPDLKKFNELGLLPDMFVLFLSLQKVLRRLETNLDQLSFDDISSRGCNL